MDSQVKRAALLGSALGLLAVAMPPRAFAQDAASPPPAQEATSSPDVIAASELFRQGRAAFDAKDYPTARARLSESARLSPHVGTLISLAECEETLGVLAAARTHWQQAVDLATGQGDIRQAFAREHLAALDPRVPRMTLRLPDDAPAGTTIRVDDVELRAASIGLAMPAELGKHVVLVVAPGRDTQRTEVLLVEHESRYTTLAIGPVTSPAATPAAATPGPVPVTPTEARAPAAESPSGGAPRVASYVTMGAGLVGVASASYLGVKAIDGKNVQGCNGNLCTSPAAATRNAAIDDGNAATWLFVGGGALLVTGAVLWVVSRRPTPSTAAVEWTPTVDSRHVGIAARLAW
jgi:hypothetical protein